MMSQYSELQLYILDTTPTVRPSQYSKLHLKAAQTLAIGKLCHREIVCSVPMLSISCRQTLSRERAFGFIRGLACLYCVLDSAWRRSP